MKKSLLPNSNFLKLEQLQKVTRGFSPLNCDVDIKKALGCRSYRMPSAIQTDAKAKMREKAEFAEGHQPAYGIAMAKAKDMSFYLFVLVRSVIILPAMLSSRLTPWIPRRAV